MDVLESKIKLFLDIDLPSLDFYQDLMSARKYSSFRLCNPLGWVLTLLWA